MKKQWEPFLGKGVMGYEKFENNVKDIKYICDNLVQTRLNSTKLQQLWS